jgi:hypothetical protein
MACELKTRGSRKHSTCRWDEEGDCSSLSVGRLQHWVRSWQGTPNIHCPCDEHEAGDRVGGRWRVSPQGLVMLAC